jgi:DNA invertase Pin-like site-specific DNA recombinase
MPTPTTPHRPCRVALYTRTRDLAASSSIGQEIRLRQFLLGHPDWHPVAEYHDYGGDGRHTRPALRRALADARFGRFDVLLVTAADRLGRDMPTVAALLTDLDRAGVTIVTADGAVNTTRPHGRFVLAVLTALAEFEAAIQTDHDSTAGPRRRRRRHGAAHQRRHGCG